MALRRNLLMQKVDSGGLPAAYEQVEYIAREESGAYIVVPFSDINLSGKDLFLDIMITSTSLGEKAFAGAVRAIIPNTEPYELYLQGTNNFYCWSSPASLISSYSGSLAINQKGSIQVTFASGYNVGLCLGQYKSDGYQTACRFYSCEIKDNGVSVRNFVPCVRKADSKPGMYETVTGTFYINAGTGEFSIPT